MQEKIPSLKKIIFIILGISITFSFFVLFSDLEKFSSQWYNLDVKYLILLLLCNFVALSIRAGRQKILLGSMGFPISLKKNFMLYFAGLSMTMTPAGTGEMVKSYFLKEHYGFELSRTFPLVIAEKFHNLLVGIIILIIALLVQPIFEAQILVIVVGIILSILFLSVKYKTLFSILIKRIPKFWIIKNLARYSEEAEEQFHRLSTNKIFTFSLMLSLSAGFVEVVGFYCGFLAFGIDIDFFISIVVMYSSIIFGALTLLPFGIGVTDLSILGLLSKFGISFSIASAFTIFIRIVLIGSSVLLGTIFLRFFIRK